HESNAVAHPKHLLALIRDQYDLTLENAYELVFGGVPMTLARPATRRQAGDVDAELGQTSGVPDAASEPPDAGFVVRSRVPGSGDRFHLIEIYSARHPAPLQSKATAEELNSTGRVRRLVYGVTAVTPSLPYTSIE